MAENGQSAKISLLGSVSLGTGVMIGAGIFALVGQVAALSGGLFPLAFVGGAIVSAFGSYAYARSSSSDPSSGGIAMILRSAYGPGAVAGTFAMFMYLSMVVAESLLARTFGTYLLRPFGLQGSPVLAPALGLGAIALALAVNLVGNRLVEDSATVTALLKITGIAVLAGAGIIGALASSGSLLIWARGSPAPDGALGVLAGVGLAVLAYKGFTTITNQGSEIEQPARNIPRSIAIAIGLCTGLYSLITVSVASSLPVDQVIQARDYALAQAADPLFGQVGVALTGVVAVSATLSGLIASLFSVSRLLAMLQDMGQAPAPSWGGAHQPLLVTAALAAAATVLMDLSRIASVGLLLYLTMDIAIQWGVLRHTHDEVKARRWIPAAALVLDATVLAAFTTVMFQRDPVTLGVGVAIAVATATWQIAETQSQRRRADRAPDART